MRILHDRTDFIQAILMIIGALVLMFKSESEPGHSYR